MDEIQEQRVERWTNYTNQPMARPRLARPSASRQPRRSQASERARQAALHALIPSRRCENDMCRNAANPAAWKDLALGAGQSSRTWRHSVTPKFGLLGSQRVVTPCGQRRRPPAVTPLGALTSTRMVDDHPAPECPGETWSRRRLADRPDPASSYLAMHAKRSARLLQCQRIESGQTSGSRS